MARCLRRRAQLGSPSPQESAVRRRHLDRRVIRFVRASEDSQLGFPLITWIRKVPDEPF